MGEGLNIDIPIGEIMARQRARKSGMKLGTIMSDPEFLAGIEKDHPELANAFRTIGPQMATGDLLPSHAMALLKEFPQRPYAAPLPPELSDWFKTQTGTSGSASGTGGSPPVPADVSAGASPRPYVKSYAPPNTGVSLEFPEPPENVAYARRGKVAEKRAESEVPSSDTLFAGKAAMQSLTDLKNLLKVGPDGVPTDVSSVPMGTTFDIQLNPQGRMFRSRYEALLSSMALLRTGKAGEEKQLEQLRNQYKIGKGERENPALLADRISQMEKEIKTRMGIPVGPTIRSIRQVK